MELIKKTINLGDLRNRETPLIYKLLTKNLKEKGCCNGLNNKQIILQNAEEFDQNWGNLDFEYIYLNVFLTQNIDDMGIFTDSSYIASPGQVDYSLILSTYSGFTIPPSTDIIFSGSIFDPYITFFGRLNGAIESDFFVNNGVISGLTDEKFYSVTSYDSNRPFIPWPQNGSNLNNDPLIYFTGIDTGGLQPDYTGYTINAEIANILFTGIHYRTYNFNRLIYNSTVDQYFSIPYTEVFYQSEGWNYSNTSLSAIFKEEIYFGIVFEPKIENNVFIDRGATSVFEKHARLKTILNMEQLIDYGNGYYNLVSSE
jgi:hypothetical protein